MENVIIRKDNIFILNTKNTTYAFKVMDSCGYLENLYYGRKINIDSTDGIETQREFAAGNSVLYEEGMDNFTLEDVSLEYSTLGKGDIREPMIEIRNSDGSNTLDFKFKSANILDSKYMIKDMPSAIDEDGNAKTLEITCKDEDNNIVLKLYYSVFPECDVITRSAKIINEGDDDIRLDRMLSMIIDFDRNDFVFTSFHGAWAKEMQRHDISVAAGKYENSSYTGTSSNRSNPFVMLSDKNTTENHGDCYGFNLIYSGNHYESVSVNPYGRTRFAQGINPQNFEFIVKAADEFESPEAIFSYSRDGFNSLSHNMHDFVNKHIVRGKYKKRVRPVLINSWEVSYFNINSNNLYKLAKTGKELGVELFVMDDGWFGKRDDDTSSLGDWDVNKKKLPGGLKPLVDKIKALGMDFGIWVEPEMINIDSNLYSAHPDWTIDIDGKNHSEGRNQRILDFTREDVQDYIIGKMTALLISADISYVKWDMNRIFSDCYSRALPKDRQGEVFHRYVLGLYRVMKTLTERFPEVLFEGCASGGNRFDLGILCYFPQIWASDNTDALCRVEMQNNYTYGYPLSTISAHVSDVPNQQTFRKIPLGTRFNVAAFGAFGYECNLSQLSNEEKEIIKNQIDLYKQWRDVFQYGTFYRGRSFDNSIHKASVLSGNDGNIMEWTCVSEDQNKAVGMLFQKLVQPNAGFMYYKPNGLKEETKYKLVDTQSKENEEHSMYGNAMMYAGVKLKQTFSGTGYNENVKLLPDFGSSMFLITENVEDK